jgi:hypothetical protein
MMLEYAATFGPFLLFYLAFTVPCLFALRQRPLDDGSRALWALVSHMVASPALVPMVDWP